MVEVQDPAQEAEEAAQEAVTIVVDITNRKEAMATTVAEATMTVVAATTEDRPRPILGGTM